MMLFDPHTRSYRPPMWTPRATGCLLTAALWVCVAGAAWLVARGVVQLLRGAW